jgi:hypothetical protein
MTISTVLKTVYASAPSEVLRIQTVDIELPGGQHVRLVNDFFDATLGVDGVPQLFEACGMDITLPNKDASGNQTLQFALGVLDDDRINGLIAQALDAGQPVYLVYREYLNTDTTAPAMAPIRMTVLGGAFDEDQLGIEGSYFDMLNTAWPRERYTLENAPGTKYL